MQWYNEPLNWHEREGRLTVSTKPQSDFWRKTHYGFVRDNGHFYGQEISGDFVAEVKVIGEYETLYDQAGLMLRLDEANWLKCGIEYVDGVQYASAVVTRDFSDWSVAPLSGSPPAFWLRITRADTAIEIHYSLDGESYALLRITYLPMDDRVSIGPMCASPGEKSFTVHFENFSIAGT
jgi:regulation of enolase protein 1 (concanavalin A-like superfamily)